jgi:putative salt-induced outer membrane protein YdiY
MSKRFATVHIISPIILSVTLSLIAIFFVPALTFGDTIVLSNGDMLTGTITRLSKSRITIDTEYGKALSIEWERVVGIETETFCFVELKDEEEIRVKIIADHEGWRLEDEKGEIRTITKEGIQRFSRKKPQYWTLEFDLSYQLTSGNTTSDDFRTALNVKKKKQKYELIFAGSYAQAETEDEILADRWDLLHKYDHLMTKKIYRRGFLFFERDKVRDIDRRFQAGPAIGYRFYDTETLRLSSDMGTLRDETKYENGDSDSEFKGLWNVEFFFIFFSDVKFEEAFRWVQGFDKEEDYEITSETSLSVPLGGGFSLKASVIERYDNQPQAGLKKNDLTSILALSCRTSF